VEEVADDDSGRQLDERDGDADLDGDDARDEHDRRQHRSKLNRVHPAPPNMSVEAISPGAGGSARASSRWQATIPVCD